MWKNKKMEKVELEMVIPQAQKQQQELLQEDNEVKPFCLRVTTSLLRE